MGTLEVPEISEGVEGAVGHKLVRYRRRGSRRCKRKGIRAIGSGRIREWSEGVLSKAGCHIMDQRQENIDYSRPRTDLGTMGAKTTRG